MKPIVPSFGYAVLTTGPPASLTRSSVPRFVIPIHADPSASARTTSLFCDASLSTFGFSCLRKSFADEICAERDPKGLYAKAKAGKLPNMTGIGQGYEAPEEPDIVVNGAGSLEETVDRLVAELT